MAMWRSFTGDGAAAVPRAVGAAEFNPSVKTVNSSLVPSAPQLLAQAGPSPGLTSSASKLEHLRLSWPQRPPVSRWEVIALLVRPVLAYENATDFVR